MGGIPKGMLFGLWEYRFLPSDASLRDATVGAGLKPAPTIFYERSEYDIAKIVGAERKS